MIYCFAGIKKQGEAVCEGYNSIPGQGHQRWEDYSG